LLKERICKKKNGGVNDPGTVMDGTQNFVIEQQTLYR